MLGRLVVHEVAVNRPLELGVFHNGVRSHPPVELIHPRFVLGVLGVVASSFPCFLRELVGDRSLGYADAAGNLLLGVPLADKDMNLIPVAFCESLLCCFFIRPS